MPLLPSSLTINLQSNPTTYHPAHASPNHPNLPLPNRTQLAHTPYYPSRHTFPATSCKLPSRLATLPQSQSFPTAGLNYKVAGNCSRRNLACQNKLFGRPRSLHPPVLITCSIKALAGKYNCDLAKFSTYLCNLASKFSNAFSLTEFPWDKAKLLVEERLIFLGNIALKWSLVVLLSFSFVSDALLAVSVNRELLVPLGLFMGVTLADFLKESCREISESRAKDGNDLLQLWSFGLFFVALRIMFLSFRIPGWVLFAHVGNGGLMQILWLAKELQLADIAQKK